jgi:hypothetical protein
MREAAANFPEPAGPGNEALLLAERSSENRDKMAAMTKNHVKEILDRVLTWPPERQADVVQVLELMEEQDNSTLRLSDEQVAEVRRRLADENAKTVTLAEFNERLRRRYGV